jgi:carbonic anhydrase/acetyltransferase-like protein (isoleucine patch superfamily)
MKPPKCRLCEHEHWTTQPHKFATNVVNTATNSETKNHKDRDVAPPTDASMGEPRRVQKRVTGEPKTRNRRAKEAYNAYQREYMRKRRAAAKA